MKFAFGFAFSACVALSTAPARADDKAACLQAASRGQTLRDAHKLIEARNEFRACAQVQCPAVVQHDCAGWLDAVEKSLATVVVSATDGRGADLIDVTVRVDGKLLTARLDGNAVAVDPGPHTFRFEAKDGTNLEQQVLIKEGDRNRSVAAVLKTGGSCAPATTPAGSSPGTSAVTATATTDHPSPGSSTWKTVGWVLGGVGLAGIGTGAVFGLTAISDKHSANCDQNNFCNPDDLHSARNAATASDIGFIAGGALLAGGLAAVLVTSAGRHEAVGPHEAGGHVGVAPVVGLRGGGLSIKGSF